MEFANSEISDDSTIEYSIVVKELDHWFGQGEARIQALFDINLNIERGKLTILRGASGSGKTTLLTLVGCLRKVEHGSVQLLGTELNNAPERTLVKSRRRLGFIFQAHNLHESLTAMQNVRMGLEVHGKEATKNWQEAAEYLLTLVGLSDRLHYLPGTLSGGQNNGWQWHELWSGILILFSPMNQLPLSTMKADFKS